MNKQESIDFLQKCIDKVETATDEEIKMFENAYKMHCDSQDLFLLGVNEGRKEGINLMSNKAKLLGYNQAMSEHNKSIHDMLDEIKTTCHDLTYAQYDTMQQILLRHIHEIDSPCM